MTPPSTTEKGVETHRRILEAAAELFLDRGYAGTSLNDIIQASGLTKGGFYFHFISKMQVALEALDLIRAGMRADIMAAAGSHRRAVDQIAAMVRAAATKHDAISSSALGRLCIDIAAEPDVPERTRPFDEWFVITAQLFRQAQAEGDMDLSVDPQAAAHFAVTSFVGMDHVAEVSGDAEGIAGHVEDYLAFCFRAVGITAPVPRPTDTGS